jgi:hypothetical protein
VLGGMHEPYRGACMRFLHSGNAAVMQDRTILLLGLSCCLKLPACMWLWFAICLHIVVCCTHMEWLTTFFGVNSHKEGLDVILAPTDLVGSPCVLASTQPHHGCR